MVSSTTPRFGPRWPPVCDSTLISSSRTSCASCGSSSSFSSLMSAGERIPSSIRCAAVAISEEAYVVILVCSFFSGRHFLFRRRLEILYYSFAGMVTSNDLDSVLGAGEAFLANLHQLHPFFVAPDQFFQHHFAGFHLLDVFLVPIHGAFEVELRFGLLWGRRHASAIQ